MNVFRNLMSTSVVIFIQMLTSITVSSISEYKLQPFDCPQTQCDRIVSINIEDDTSEKLYITTTTTLMELTEDLSKILERKTVNRPEDQNVLTILRGSEILNCKNDLNGTCELRDMVSLDVISTELTQTGIVYPGGGPILGWIYKDSRGGYLLTTAISNKDRGDGSVPLPLVATRTFPVGINSSAGFLEYLQNDFNVPSAFFPPSSSLVDEIDPFYGFYSGSYNYILKKHTNENGGTQIKIIRFCKGSINMWSYMELPIECHGDVSVSDRGIVSSTAYFTNDILYISITETKGYIPESYVCNYSISTINEEFTKRRRECLEGKSLSTELSWYQSSYCPQTPPPQFNFSLLNDPDYCYDEPHAQPLGGTKPIVQEAMAQLTINEVVSAILVVIPADESEAIEYLLGDKEGNVHRISDDRRETEVVDVGQAILDRSGLLLHPNGEYVYAASNRKIVKLFLKQSWTTQHPPTTTNSSRNTLQFSWLVVLGCYMIANPRIA